MHDKQLDFFIEESVVYPKGTEIFDTPDDPPEVGYADVYWWILNRWAEWNLRWLRSLGIL